MVAEVIQDAGGVVALCKTGTGCQCSTNNTAEDLLLALGFGTSVPDGFAGDQRTQTIVIDASGRQVYRSAAPRGQFNESYGGTGPCDPEPEPHPTPRDGTWQWRILNETTSGCPPMLAGDLAASRVETLATRVTWDGRFDPRRLADSLSAPEMGEMSPCDWRELAPNRWLSDNLQVKSCEDGTCVEAALALNMNLVASDRITGLMTLRSRVEGPRAAILAGFGMADCRVRVRYRIDRISP